MDPEIVTRGIDLKKVQRLETTTANHTYDSSEMIHPFAPLGETALTKPQRKMTAPSAGTKLNGAVYSQPSSTVCPKPNVVSCPKPNATPASSVSISELLTQLATCYFTNRKVSRHDGIQRDPQITEAIRLTHQILLQFSETQTQELQSTVDPHNRDMRKAQAASLNDLQRDITEELLLLDENTDDSSALKFQKIMSRLKLLRRTSQMPIDTIICALFLLHTNQTSDGHPKTIGTSGRRLEEPPHANHELERHPNILPAHRSRSRPSIDAASACKNDRRSPVPTLSPLELLPSKSLLEGRQHYGLPDEQGSSLRLQQRGTNNPKRQEHSSVVPSRSATDISSSSASGLGMLQSISPDARQGQRPTKEQTTIRPYSQDGTSSDSSRTQSRESSTSQHGDTPYAHPSRPPKQEDDDDDDDGGVLIRSISTEYDQHQHHSLRRYATGLTHDCAHDNGEQQYHNQKNRKQQEKGHQQQQRQHKSRHPLSLIEPDMPIRKVPPRMLERKDGRRPSKNDDAEDDVGGGITIQQRHHEYRPTNHDYAPVWQLTAAEVSEGLYYKGLPQAVILKDIMYPLQGIDGMYIKHHEESNAFLIRRDINVSEAVRILVTRLCVLGMHYRRTRQHLDSHLLPTASSKRVPEQEVNAWWNDNGLSVTVMPSSGTLDQGSHLPVPTIQSPGSMSSDSPRPLGSDANGQNQHQPQPVFVLSRSEETLRPRIPQKPRVAVRSLIYDAFCQFLRDQLTEYYKLLAVIETELSECDDGHHGMALLGTVSPTTTLPTLRRLTVWLQNPIQRIATLAAVADSVVGLKAAPLLSTVFDFSRRGDTGVQVLLTNMLNAISALWYDMVLNWICYGYLSDPYDEFCIIQNPKCWKGHSESHRIQQETGATEGATRKGSSCYQTNIKTPYQQHHYMGSDLDCLNGTLPEFLWKFGFALDMNRIPVFISQTLATKILTSGKAIATIRLFQFLETTRLHPSAVYMRSNAHRDSMRGEVTRCFKTQTFSATGYQQCPMKSITLRERDGRQQTTCGAIEADSCSDYGMKSDISVVNSGSPIGKYSRPEAGRMRDESRSTAGVSPLKANASFYKKQPKYIRLLESMSSGIGITQNLLLGVFDPTSDFTDGPSLESNADSIHLRWDNQGYDHHQVSALRSHGTVSSSQRFSMDGHYNSEMVRQAGLRFLRNLCGTIHSFEFPMKSSEKQNNPRLFGKVEQRVKLGEENLVVGTTVSSDVKHLESQVNQMEAKHCNKIIDLLLFRYHLLCHCEGIRRFLLLGQGDFVECLLSQFTPVTVPVQAAEHRPLGFDFLGCDLNQTASNVLVHHLRGCLQAAVSASNAHLFPDEILRRVDINKLRPCCTKASRELIGWDVVHLTYITDGSPISLILNQASIKGYCKLHSLLWRIQRVSSSMNRIWCDYLRTARRRLLPVSASTRVKQKTVGIILEALNGQSQWAVQRCESLHCEMTHFLRNVYSYLSIEVIETCWVEFLQRVASLCGMVQHGPSSSEDDPVTSHHGGAHNEQHHHGLSLVDRLIRTHEEYVESMLHGAFLDTTLLTNESMVTMSALDILSSLNHHHEQHQPHPPILQAKSHSNTHLNQQSIHHDTLRMKEGQYPPVLETLLLLIKATMDFVELAELIYASIYAHQDGQPDLLHHRQQHPERTDVKPAVPLVLVARLNSLSASYTDAMNSFLKQLNTVAKTVPGGALQHHLGNSHHSPLPAAVCQFSSSFRSNAIRALLSRLDFNGYFGTDWELYRVTPSAGLLSTPVGWTNSQEQQRTALSFPSSYVSTHSQAGRILSTENTIRLEDPIQRDRRTEDELHSRHRQYIATEVEPRHHSNQDSNPMLSSESEDQYDDQSDLYEYDDESSDGSESQDDMGRHDHQHA